jgi:NAD(P)H-flavin reductase
LAIEGFLALYLKIDKGQLAHISRVSDDILHFEMARPEGFSIKPGHYLQLRIPELKRYEWHPLSLTGGEGTDEMIVLKIKRQGDWTNQLFNLLRPQPRELIVDIRGPYASPVARANQHRQQQLSLIAGGIGITPFLGVMRSIIANPLSNKQFDLVWVLRDSKLLSWLEPILNSPSLKTPILGRIKIHLYLTDNAGPNDLPLWFGSESENRVVLNQQRPEWAPLLAQIAQELERPHCFVCGPDALTKAAANQCRRRGWPVSIEQF